MMLLGMAFKVSAVPFHFWTADVYYGAPTQITAYMATIAKTAAFAAFLRLFLHAFPFVSGVWVYPLIIISILTMLLGNVLAIYQSEVKRMLAYSSIAHAGYMLMALLSQNEYTSGSIVYYSLSYSIASLLAFNVYRIVMKSSHNNGGFDAFIGLSKRSPLLAAAALVAMLSLAGIPPLAGFFAKYYVFASALEAGHRVMVLFAVLASLVSIYYYFKIIINTFTGEPKNNSEVPIVEGTQKLLLIVGIVLLIALGLAPEMIVRWH
jgi:NADH-quinone oxidoreductase subunit N